MQQVSYSSEVADYLASIRADGSAVASVVGTHPLSVPVSSCPGWNLGDLARHLGYVHRWARMAAVSGVEPDDDSIDTVPHVDGPAAGAALASWLTAGVDALVEALDGIAPDEPTWHPFPVPRVAAVWPRRQAHELAVHRWDAEAAVGVTSPFDPALAADFVCEYFEVIVPRVMDRDGRTPPVGTVQVQLVDVARTLVVRSTASTVALADTDTVPTLHHAPAARIAGRAEDVLLALWRRQPLRTPPDDAVAAAWLAFGGN